MPAGQISEFRTYLYVCQTAADIDCDQRGDVGDRETVARDKQVSVSVHDPSVRIVDARPRAVPHRSPGIA